MTTNQAPATPYIDRASYPELSARDWTHILRLGLPASADARLLEVDDEGGLTFTERGFQFYQAAFDVYGVAADPRDLDWAGLLEVAIVITNGLVERNRGEVRAHIGQLTEEERHYAKAYLAQGEEQSA